MLNYQLDPLNHFHVWQVPHQLNCVDIRFFDNSETREINEWKKHTCHPSGHYKDHFPGLLQLIWRLGSRRFHLRVPNLQVSCRESIYITGHQERSLGNGWRATCTVNLATKTPRFFKHKAYWPDMCHKWVSIGWSLPRSVLLPCGSGKEKKIIVSRMETVTSGCHFADDIFKSIFLRKTNLYASIRISFNVVLKGPVDNNSALAGVVAWRRTSDN